MASWVWIVIAVAIVVVAVAIVGLVLRARRTRSLRERFGPEYERTTQQAGRHAAERDLRNRQRQREQLEIRPLPESARARYAEEWRQVQERFVDQPASAVMSADELVRRVMGDEGYPMEDFNAQSELVSVDHPRVVENFRRAHGVYERTQNQQASTEDMRAALLSYRSLFDELLATGAAEPDGRPSAAPAEQPAARQEQAQDESGRR